MNTPRVSIGMPVYNGERYLADAIRSLLDQTFTDFELLIADNCSTDDTLKIANEFAAKDQRIKVVSREQNRGAIDNFNFVFRETGGEFFKWAASDDLCAPTYLEKCVETLDQTPDVTWCHCDSDKVDAHGNSLLGRLPENDPTVEVRGGKLCWKGFPRNEFANDSPAVRFREVILGTTWCVDSYGLFRRSVLEKSRMLINVYGAEKVLIGEVSLIGKYAHVYEPLFAQRIHEEASSAIASHAKQQEYMGAKRRSYLKTRFALFRAHLRSIHRQRLSWTNRIRSYWALTQYVFQFQKWLAKLGEMFSRKGIGGAGKQLLNNASAANKSDASAR